MRIVLSLSIFLILFSFLPAFCHAEDQYSVPYNPETVEINGYIEGYPEKAIEEDNFRLFLAHDGEKIFVHLTIKAEGWVGLGFNAPDKGKEGANLLIGYFESGKGRVKNQVGVRGGHRDTGLDVGEFFFTRIKEFKVLEFSYPLNFPEGYGFNLEGLNLDSEIEILIAYHSSSHNIYQKHTFWEKIRVFIE